MGLNQGSQPSRDTWVSCPPPPILAPSAITNLLNVIVQPRADAHRHERALQHVEPDLHAVAQERLRELQDESPKAGILLLLGVRYKDRRRS